MVSRCWIDLGSFAEEVGHSGQARLGQRCPRALDRLFEGFTARDTIALFLGTSNALFFGSPGALTRFFGEPLQRPPNGRLELERVCVVRCQPQDVVDSSLRGFEFTPLDMFRCLEESLLDLLLLLPPGALFAGEPNALLLGTPSALTRFFGEPLERQAD